MEGGGGRWAWAWARARAREWSIGIGDGDGDGNGNGEAAMLALEYGCDFRLRTELTTLCLRASALIGVATVQGKEPRQGWPPRQINDTADLPW